MNDTVMLKTVMPADEAEHWRETELPDAWPDKLSWRQPGGLLRLFWGLLRGQTRRLQMPEALQAMTADFPKYLFQEFHHLPNGNYSKRIASGYARSFDHVMLGELRRARQALAEKLKDCSRVLDIGAGGGHLSGSLLQAGIPEVWGLEPSPYLLQLAARQYPNLKLKHGVAEHTGFADASFDALAACFVFHEIPPRHSDKVLVEAQRILKRNGMLAWIEPSPTQLELPLKTLLRRFGWRGWYYRLMAQRMHEPFVAAWHQREKASWLAQHGFELLELHDQMPWQRVVARKIC